MIVDVKASDVFGAIREHLRGETIAAMLFGSVARGDANCNSDTDILQVCRRYRPSYKAGRFSFSVYTPESIAKIARKGSLFALHLRMEGVLLFDPENVLSSVLGEYRPPRSYDPFL